MPNATRSFNSHPDLLKNGNNGRPLYEAERKRTRDQNTSLETSTNLKRRIRVFTAY